MSQIPALLISTAAGIVVTRVASEDEGSHLGRDIGRQILAQPRAIAIAAGLLLLLALIPGLPTMPFLLLGLVAGSMAWSLLRARRRAAAGASAAGGGRSGAPSQAEGLEPPPSHRAGGGRGADALHRRLPPAAVSCMGELIPGLRELLHAELGVMLPGVHVRRGDRLCAAAGLPHLALRGPHGRGGDRPPTHLLAPRPTPSGWRADGVERCRRPSACRGSGAGLPRATAAARRRWSGRRRGDRSRRRRWCCTWARCCKTYAYEFVGIQETQALLDSSSGPTPPWSTRWCPRCVSVQALAEVLRRLVEEEISIRDLREHPAGARRVGASGARSRGPGRARAQRALRRLHQPQVRAGVGVLPALLLDPTIEEAVRDSIQTHRPGQLPGHGARAVAARSWRRCRPQLPLAPG